MFCSKCGVQLPEGSSVCPNCGEPLSFEQKAERFADEANEAFARAEKQLDDAIIDVGNAISPGSMQPRGMMPLKEDRSLVLFIVLTLCTCGIYAYYFVYSLAQDVNIACQGDGDDTPGLIAYICLSFITCGFYSIYWEYKLGNRLAANAPRYGMEFREDGTTVLLWHIFGMLICGIGGFIAMNILIRNSNAICSAYNRGWR